MIMGIEGEIGPVIPMLAKGISKRTSDTATTSNSTLTFRTRRVSWFGFCAPWIKLRSYEIYNRKRNENSQIVFKLFAHMQRCRRFNWALFASDRWNNVSYGVVAVEASELCIGLPL